jgi:hypothetical protein
MHSAINVLQSSRHRVRFWTPLEPPLRTSISNKKSTGRALVPPPLFSTDFSRTTFLRLHPSTHGSAMVVPPLHPRTSRYDTPSVAQARRRRRDGLWAALLMWHRPSAAMSRSTEASTGDDDGEQACRCADPSALPSTLPSSHINVRFGGGAATLLLSTLFIRKKVCRWRGLLVQRNHSWSRPCCRSGCSCRGAAPLRSHRLRVVRACSTCELSSLVVRNHELVVFLAGFCFCQS